MRCMGMGSMMTWGLLWGVVGLALLGLAVAGVVFLVRQSDQDRGGRDGQESAEDFLKRRYAAGQIDEDEFLRRRAGLY